MRLRDAIDVYIDNLRSEPKRSQNTILSQKSDLKQLLKYFSDTVLETITSDMLKEYFGVLVDEKGLSPFTVNRQWSTVKSFFQYWRERGVIEKHPQAGIHVPVKVQLQKPVVLTRNEMRQLLNAPAREVEKLKNELSRRKAEGLHTEALEKNLDESICNRAVIELLFATGMKVGELVNLRVKDFNFHNNTVLIKNETGSQRLGYYPSDVVNAVLNEWSLIRNKFIVGQSPAFFVNTRGNALHPESVRKIVRKYAESANIKKPVTPYTLRHTLVSLLFNTGADVPAIQQILGASSNLMIQFAIKNSKPTLQSALKKADPRHK